MEKTTTRLGVVSRVESKQVYVMHGGQDREVSCSLKGKFKLEYRLKKDKLITSDVVVVGDHVRFDLLKDGSGVVKKIEPRKNFISRKAPRVKGGGKRGERFEQVLMANVDKFFIVLSVDRPLFNNKTLDRYLVIGESSGISTEIIINKSDLIVGDEFRPWADLYRTIGYPVHLIAAKHKRGLAPLKAAMQGKINLFWGPSGAGKSSLLNALFPGMNLRIGEISDFSGKGTHTTVNARMIKVDGHTFIVDTPGVREVEPFGIRKHDLAHYLPDFIPFINECKFSTCTHHHEPHCAIIRAAESGVISSHRYESYLRMLETIEDDIFF